MIYYKYTNFKLALNNFKKIKKNILTSFRKRRHLRKISLIANNLIKKIIIRSENR